VIRRPRSNTIALLAGLTTALALLACFGCGPEDTVRDLSETGGVTTEGSMTEADYIAHIAALTVAVGEGLTGEAAIERAKNLGSAGHTREEVERFAERLKTRPERWLRIEKEIEERINVMTRPAPPGEDEPR